MWEEALAKVPAGQVHLAAGEAPLQQRATGRPLSRSPAPSSISKELSKMERKGYWRDRGGPQGVWPSRRVN